MTSNITLYQMKQLDHRALKGGNRKRTAPLTGARRQKNPSLCFNLDSANCECVCVGVCGCVCGGRADTARGCLVQGLSAQNIWVSDTQSWHGLEQQDCSSDSTCWQPTQDAGCTEEIHKLKYIQVWNENKGIFRSHGRRSDNVSQQRKCTDSGIGWTIFSAA